MRVARVALAALLLGACGGHSAAKAPVAPKAQPDIDPAQAESDAKGLVTEVYESIGHGDTDSLMTLLSDKLIVFGPRRADALATRTDALVALAKVVDAKNKKPLQSSSLTVTPSPGGHSAWGFDRIESGGDQLAVLVLLTNTDDIWLVHAVSVSELPAATTLRQKITTDALVPSAMSAPSKAAAIDGNAKPVLDLFTKGLLAQDVWGADLAAATGGLVAGPGQGELEQGAKAIKAAWKKRLKANTREVALGEVGVSLTPDGRLAWVSAPVTRISDGDSVPLRVFAVYQKTDDWHMVALQESVAVEGAGAGSAFHKAAPAITPVPADKPAVVAVVKVEPEKKKHKKAKKVEATEEPVAAVEDPPKKPKKSKKKVKPVDDDATATASADDAPPPPKKKHKKIVVDEDTASADDAPPPPKKKHKKIVDEDTASASADDAPPADDDTPPPKKKHHKKPKPVDDDSGN